MAYYFCLRDAISKLKPLPDEGAAGSPFLLVTPDVPADIENREDVLVLSGAEVLKLGGEEGAFNLTALLAQNPLYRLNTEILMDGALVEAESNTDIRTALEHAFPPQQYPQHLSGASHKPEEGNLHHPALAHMSDAELALAYCNFVQHLAQHTAQNYTLTHILRQHGAGFLAEHNGYADKAGTFIALEYIFTHANRADYDPSHPIEDYIENGRERATSMGLKTFDDIARAYLQAEQYQLRRAQDIEGIMSLKLDTPPHWVRQDIFALLEREAMKQVFGLHLIESPDFAALFKTRPNLKKSIEIHANGHVDTELQQLLSETLNENSRYSGSAGRFAAKVENRLQES